MARKVDRGQKRLLVKFIKVFSMTFLLLLLVAGLATGAYVLLAKNSLFESWRNKAEDRKAEEAAREALMGKPNTTLAIFGVDKDGFRTDVAMVAVFNHRTADVDIVSIPRDTQIRIPDDIYEEITSRRKGVSQNVKINEVPAYVKSEDRNKVSVKVMEETFGVEIDHYVNMDLDGFKYMVDMIGGVPMEVPMDMKYSDPEQDLEIDLKAGQQTLSGSQAEQLVRFRKGYADGDIGRISVQHTFMKAFMAQLLKVDNRLNIMNIGASALLYVDTDFSNALDYTMFIDQITPEKIHMHMLPGEVNDRNRAYYTYDYEETKLLFEQILSGTVREGEEGEGTEDGEGQSVEPAKIINPKDLAISVQNGTRISGFAAKTKDRLAQAGYTVLEAVNYENKPVQTTRLKVPTQEVGEALAREFNNPKIEVDESLLDQELEIIIILGESDGNQ
ncbi:LCP family protein [Anaerotalea alkaliphila]|uniref:LCP family protein n=1 Tax=Anaerotalea alkaliphila TaxID=2662126 RepID=A0A7X5HW05_9FIRM|nr:LCP family protein [Anaerotalea alkaliphila]NDL67659.1 LCP family protein [Anaerotalea alkaliphila]